MLSSDKMSVGRAPKRAVYGEAPSYTMTVFMAYMHSAATSSRSMRKPSRDNASMSFGAISLKRPTLRSSGPNLV